MLECKYPLLSNSYDLPVQTPLSPRFYQYFQADSINAKLRKRPNGLLKIYCFLIESCYICLESRAWDQF